MAEAREQSRALNRERTIWVLLLILAFAFGMSQGSKRHGDDPYQGLQDRDPLFGD